MLQDQYRAIMQYSIPKELCPQNEKAPSHKASADWFCIKCGAQNFKRRELCFKCHASRMESEEGGSGSDEICNYTTKTIMLRNLDALTTEDTIMSVLSNVIEEHVKKISAVAIGRDPLTSTSRGICYLGTESTVDALSIFGALNNLSPPLSIDGKTVILSYCKYNMGDTKHLYSEPENNFSSSASVPTNYTLNDVDSLAEYSANKYAKNAAEYQHYFNYYKHYFTQQINAGNSITLQQENQMDAANAAAAVAQSAIQQLQANKTFFDTTHMSVPNGTDGKRYPIPDVTKYTYEKSSGYYYDASTGLYYDQNSQYYWNSVIQKYLYWDREKLTYVLAPSNYDQTGVAQPPAEEPQQSITKKTKPEKQDKVKVAKKIAKDMERWAKTLNQKKDAQPQRPYDSIYGASNASGSADIGFSVLEKKANQNHISNGYTESDMSNAQTPLVAAYGGESESSDEEEKTKINDLDFLDFNTLICNLCKRMLPNSDALTKHAQFSAIHKQNLENLKSKKRKIDRDNDKQTIYRDRAKERRLKYGDPDEPAPSKLKEKYLKSREMEMPPVTSSVLEPIGADNKGNKLLQKMGWTEGQGLGKSNQGRTTIIQAEQRVSSVGLGSKSGTYQAVAGESYKDCVKKMMYARYQELSEKD